MRPVYFPAILSPCYGLPLCNYILIPLAPPRVSSWFVSFPLCLLPSAPHPPADSRPLPPLVIVINLHDPVRCFSLITSLVLSETRARIGKRVLHLLRNGVRPLFSLSGDIVTYPRLVALSLPYCPRGTFIPQIELRLAGVNKKGPRSASVRVGNSFCIFFIPALAPLVVTSAFVLNY